MVAVVRSGEVIPEIVAVLTDLRTGDEREISPPEKCPLCETVLQKDRGKVAIYCPNPHCSARIQGKFEIFVGKDGLNIDGVGEKQIELFLDLGWISTLDNLFSLSTHREELLQLP